MSDTSSRRGPRVICESPRIVEHPLDIEFDDFVVRALASLAQEPAEDRVAYRFRVQVGDRVRLPDGRTGAVYLVELTAGGNCKVISIRLDKPKRRWRWWLPPLPVRLADGEIDALTELASAEEIQAVLDDPVALGLDP